MVEVVCFAWQNRVKNTFCIFCNIFYDLHNCAEERELCCDQCLIDNTTKSLTYLIGINIQYIHLQLTTKRNRNVELVLKKNISFFFGTIKKIILQIVN
jgi:hypothetical protein